jgi:hypothetical protein
MLTRTLQCHKSGEKSVDVDEHTKKEQIQPPSPPRAASPTCVSQVAWGMNEVKIFVVNSNFLMKNKKVLVQQEKRSLEDRSQPHIFQSQTKAFPYSGSRGDLNPFGHLTQFGQIILGFN